jgi:hypothetical protein
MNLREKYETHNFGRETPWKVTAWMTRMKLDG